MAFDVFVVELAAAPEDEPELAPAAAAALAAFTLLLLWLAREPRTPPRTAARITITATTARSGQSQRRRLVGRP